MKPSGAELTSGRGIICLTSGKAELEAEMIDGGNGDEAPRQYYENQPGGGMTLRNEALFPAIRISGKRRKSCLTNWTRSFISRWTLPPVTKTTSARGISRKTMMVCGKIGRAKRCFVTRPMGTRKPDCGRKMLPRGTEAGDNGCSTDSCADRQSQLSRLCFGQCGNSIPAR